MAFCHHNNRKYSQLLDIMKGAKESKNIYCTESKHMKDKNDAQATLEPEKEALWDNPCGMGIWPSVHSNSSGTEIFSR